MADPGVTRPVARSGLFVPANRASWIDKAPGYGADALVLDLEDATPPEEKEVARVIVAERLAGLAVERVRVVGRAPETLRVAARAVGVHLADDPVTRSGRVELLHYLREQTISRTTHRYGSHL